MKEQVAEEWIQRGKHDLEAAKILLGHGKYLDVAVFHIHQAIEKHPKVPHPQGLGIKESTRPRTTHNRSHGF